MSNENASTPNTVESYDTSEPQDAHEHVGDLEARVHELVEARKKFDELLRSLDDDQLEDAYSIADKMAWAASGDTIAADKVSEDIMALAIARQTKGVEGKEEREALARSVQEAFGRTALESTYKDDL